MMRGLERFILEEKLEMLEIDTAHIDSYLSYYENKANLHRQFGSGTSPLSKSQIIKYDEISEERKRDHFTPNIKLPFDPIKRSKEIEDMVMEGKSRAYYRFRHAKFYGGIITADAIGCNLLCGYCWNYERNKNPEAIKMKFYNPGEVAEKLKNLMKKHDIKQFRISGCEPFLGETSAKHLGDIIKQCKARCIIETNGMMIGYTPGLLDHIPKKNVLIRITIKADNKDDFQNITGAESSAYKYQIQAIKALTTQERPYILALMKQFVSMEELGDRVDEAKIDLDDTLLATDIEGLLYYPQNIESMKARNLKEIYNKKERDRILTDAKKVSMEV